jgi:hypothetical protein
MISQRRSASFAALSAALDLFGTSPSGADVRAAAVCQLTARGCSSIRTSAHGVAKTFDRPQRFVCPHRERRHHCLCCLFAEASKESPERGEAPTRLPRMFSKEPPHRASALLRGRGLHHARRNACLTCPAWTPQSLEATPQATPWQNIVTQAGVSPRSHMRGPRKAEGDYKRQHRRFASLAFRTRTGAVVWGAAVSALRQIRPARGGPGAIRVCIPDSQNGNPGSMWRLR